MQENTWLHAHIALKGILMTRIVQDTKYELAE